MLIAGKRPARKADGPEIAVLQLHEVLSVPASVPAVLVSARVPVPVPRTTVARRPAVPDVSQLPLHDRIPSQRPCFHARPAASPHTGRAGRPDTCRVGRPAASPDTGRADRPAASPDTGRTGRPVAGPAIRRTRTAGLVRRSLLKFISPSRSPCCFPQHHRPRQRQSSNGRPPTPRIGIPLVDRGFSLDSVSKSDTFTVSWPINDITTCVEKTPVLIISFSNKIRPFDAYHSLTRQRRRWTIK